MNGNSGPDSTQRRYLVRDNSPGQFRVYQPLEEHTGLCMTFAGLAETETAVLQFANQYGALGEPSEHVVFSAKGGPMVSGESLSGWFNEIRLMRDMVALLGDVRKPPTQRNAALKKTIQWKSGKRRSVVYSPGPHRSRVIASETHMPETFARFSWPELMKPAMAVIQQVVNEKLEAHTAPALLSDTSDQLGLYFRPSCLLGALWLQFALALSQGGTFRECAHCGTYFEVAPGAARSDKKTCSASCRVMASRARKKGEDHAET